MQLSSHVTIRLYQKDDVEDIIKIIHRSMERDRFGKRVSIEEFEVEERRKKFILKEMD
jgi:flagellar motor component MotA